MGFRADSNIINRKQSWVWKMIRIKHKLSIIGDYRKAVFCIKNREESGQWSRFQYPVHKQHSGSFQWRTGRPGHGLEWHSTMRFCPPWGRMKHKWVGTSMARGENHSQKKKDLQSQRSESLERSLPCGTWRRFGVKATNDALPTTQPSSCWPVAPGH